MACGMEFTNSLICGTCECTLRSRSGLNIGSRQFCNRPAVVEVYRCEGKGYRIELKVMLEEILCYRTCVLFGGALYQAERDPNLLSGRQAYKGAETDSREKFGKETVDGHTGCQNDSKLWTAC